MGTALAVGLIVGGISAATMATTTAIQASQQNKAMRAAAESVNRAAVVQMRQIRSQEALEREKRKDVAHILRQRLRVAAGETGIGYGGTFGALMQQVDIDEAMNLQILSRNALMQMQYARSGAEANLAQLESSIISPILSGVASGIAGFGQGMAIGSAVAGTGGGGGPAPTPAGGGGGGGPSSLIGQNINQIRIQ